MAFVKVKPIAVKDMTNQVRPFVLALKANGYTATQWNTFYYFDTEQEAYDYADQMQANNPGYSGYTFYIMQVLDQTDKNKIREKQITAKVKAWVSQTE